jgi:hypothetical protein
MLLAERFDQISNCEHIRAVRCADVSLCLLYLSESKPRLSRKERGRQLPLRLLCKFYSRLSVTRAGFEPAIRSERSRALDQR